MHQLVGASADGMVGRDLQFSIDRGGTFTDVFAEASPLNMLGSTTVLCHKLILSYTVK